MPLPLNLRIRLTRPVVDAAYHRQLVDSLDAMHRKTCQGLRAERDKSDCETAAARMARDEAVRRVEELEARVSRLIASCDAFEKLVATTVALMHEVDLDRDAWQALAEHYADAHDANLVLMRNAANQLDGRGVRPA